MSPLPYWPPEEVEDLSPEDAHRFEEPDRKTDYED